jgi:saccharopepsin
MIYKAAFQLVYIVHRIPQARFNIRLGEYEPQFANISNNPQISTWPKKSPSRWNILIDAVIVNKDIIVPRSSVNGAPSNKAVSLLDTGASYSYVFSVTFQALNLHAH